MAPKRKKPVTNPEPFKGQNGFDLMGGREIKTRPATLKPPLVPGTGMGMGMSSPE